MIARLETGSGDATFRLLDVIPAENIPQAGPAFSFTVASWSMFPTIHQGDILTIEAPEHIRNGDVVVFVLAGSLVCHRVTGIENDGDIRTRGDAADRDDAPIRQRDVIGRVSVVQRGSSRFAPAPSRTEASAADRLRMRMVLLRASLGERCVGWALNTLACLKRLPPIRAAATFVLARHVRFFLGVRVPLQFVHAYRFAPLAEAADGDRADSDDVVIQARLGRLRLGTFHPLSNVMHVRRAMEGLGLEEQFRGVLQNFGPARPSLDPR